MTTLPERRGRRGNCYVAIESLFWLMGGKDSGWVPHTVRHEGDVHWFLARKLAHRVRVKHSWKWKWADVEVLDPTAAQFETPVPYHLGRARGFLTREPSKRARALMDRILWSDRDPTVPKRHGAVVTTPQVAKLRRRKPAKSRPGRRGTHTARR